MCGTWPSSRLFIRLTVLLRAVQVRGLDLSRPRWNRPWQWPGYLGRVLSCAPIVTVPLLVGALRSTGMMAMVADARAFGVMPAPTTSTATARSSTAATTASRTSPPATYFIWGDHFLLETALALNDALDPTDL